MPDTNSGQGEVCNYKNRPKRTRGGHSYESTEEPEATGDRGVLELARQLEGATNERDALRIESQGRLERLNGLMDAIAQNAEDAALQDELTRLRAELMRALAERDAERETHHTDPHLQWSGLCPAAKGKVRDREPSGETAK